MPCLPIGVSLTWIEAPCKMEVVEIFTCNVHLLEGMEIYPRAAKNCGQTPAISTYANTLPSWAVKLTTHSHPGGHL
jgi:hypothetical protein